MTTRQLLEQALEALDNSVDLVYEEYTEATRRYANMPSRKAKLDGLAALAKAHDAARYAIRAELAKPEQQERKPMTQDDIHEMVRDGVLNEGHTATVRYVEAFHNIDGGPNENRVKCCHGCGRPVAMATKEE